MDIAALSSAMAAQSVMGQLLVKTFDQTQQLVEQSAAIDLSQASAKVAAQIDGLGENIDLIA